MNCSYDSAYYEDLQGRLRGVLIATEAGLSVADATLVAEFIDANECGLALETLSDSLVAANATVDAAVYEDIRALAAMMGLPEDVAQRLAPLVNCTP